VAAGAPSQAQTATPEVVDNSTKKYPKNHPGCGVNRHADDQEDQAQADRPGPTFQGGLDDGPPAVEQKWGVHHYLLECRLATTAAVAMLDAGAKPAPLLRELDAGKLPKVMPPAQDVTKPSRPASVAEAGRDRPPARLTGYDRACVKYRTGHRERRSGTLPILPLRT
jgi:hypothetical protein